ncbi:hypothetical protein HO173_009079 [Letharia columbiana]|uniref:Rhodopsin domain-containing protein n=1 Tax=Letharia columbiana TaxID=112416 RepID=A0A8H6L234_9LECA|nr:uncharacterized protein HO173_009079 [Letharia columbiana]KAF6232640.1 hypothetical protein HO173_009079 [Letharia columbiana]
MYQRSASPSHGDAMGITVIVINSVFLGLAAVAVGMRLWSRKIQRHGLFLNDYASVLSWSFAASLVITSNTVIIHDGSDKHIQYVDPTRIPDILKAYLASDVAWAAANTSIRISIVHFYITIFRSNRAFLIATYAVMVLVVAFGIGIVVSDFLTCRPLSKYWDPLQSGICESPLGSLIALSGCNVAMDLTIVLLPMPMVWGLQMTTRRKIELTITFALGFLVCIVTIVRLILSIHMNLDDFTYGITKIAIVTILEPLLGIIIACLPLFPPTVKKITGYSKETNSETRNVLSSSMARLRLKRSRNSAFQRFKDSSLLSDLEHNKTQIDASDATSKPDSLVDGRSPFAAVEVPPPHSSIHMKQEWEVRSDEAKNLDGKLRTST